MIIEKKKITRLPLTPQFDSIPREDEVEFGMASVPARVVKLSKGSFIFQSGDLSNEIFLISSGCVKVAKPSGHGSEVVKTISGRGSVFGEKALTGEKKRDSYAQAVVNDTEVYAYKVEDVLNNSRNDSELNVNILGIFGKKISMLESRLESIISKDSRTRIVDFLREMAEENGKKVGFETLIKNNFTHKDIASLTGTSRQTVTTTLNSLKDQNIINFDRRRILIRDMDLLK
ncbi:Crp/Fnr family transcriptional regulator [Reichenbachiella versicolor]|uniref:Crp/Fnr family transcriptional regulator n=1 Tax=Reichenbachiella versicolor TaxID=1821036 RepID=UPI000D6DF886|nr:Crp/Fnr family transcriptional regulator [Reichenbachiella versicolor]